MMKVACFLVIFLFAECTSVAQKTTSDAPVKSYRLEIEELEPPNALLEEVNIGQIYKTLMAKEAGYGSQKAVGYSPRSTLVQQDW